MALTAAQKARAKQLSGTGEEARRTRAEALIEQAVALEDAAFGVLAGNNNKDGDLSIRGAETAARILSQARSCYVEADKLYAGVEELELVKRYEDAADRLEKLMRGEGVGSDPMAEEQGHQEGGEVH